MKTGSSAKQRCCQCRRVIDTIGRLEIDAPILCRECFGPRAYERRGRAWNDVLYHGLVQHHDAEEEAAL